MIIHTQIQLADYIKLNYTLSYRKWSSILVLICGLLFLSTGLFAILSGEQIVKDPWINLTIGVFIVFIYPLYIYFISRKNFDSHRTLKKEITYEFSDQSIKTHGDGFHGEMEIKDIFKVVELKDWFLLYHSRQVVNLIPKKGMNSQQIHELRSMFPLFQNPKNKLRNN